jgi:hypothetical protein
MHFVQGAEKTSVKDSSLIQCMTNFPCFIAVDFNFVKVANLQMHAIVRQVANLLTAQVVIFHLFDIAIVLVTFWMKISFADRLRRCSHLCLIS